MADSIVKLRVESSEYDAKLKRATQGLLHMEESCRKVGGTLAVLEKDEREFVRSLGNMETVSKDARGRVNELTKAFTELSVQYNRLSDEEKKGHFGQDLRYSLDQLAERTRNAKAELNNIQGEISTNGSLLDQLSGKFGVNVTQLATWGGALGAGKVALDVMKDAFFQSESNIDEWGRTVKGAEGAYDVFLQSINNGNWSNFFTNLSTAVQGARDLYDALDRLGSIKANNQAAIAIVQQQVQQLRLQKQQGKNVDAQLKAATERLAQLQGQAVNAGKNAGRKTMSTTIRNSVNTTLPLAKGYVSDAAINNAVNNILTNGQPAFDSYASTYKRLKNKATAKDREESYTSSTGQTYTRTIKGGFNIDLLTKEERKQYALAKAITERETELQKGISTYAQAVQEGATNAKEQFKNNRYSLTGASGGTGGKGGTAKTTITAEVVIPEGSILEAEKKLQELQKKYKEATSDEDRNYLKLQIEDANREMDKLLGKTAEFKSPALELGLAGKDVDINALNAMGGLKPNGDKTYAWYQWEEKGDAKKARNKKDGDDKDKKKNDDTVVKEIGKMTEGIGSVVGGLEQLGIDIPEGLNKTLGVMQALLSIVSGISTVVIAIAAMNSIPFLHTGGLIHAAKGVFVPGAPNGGRDTVPAMLSPGELVLNQAQQSSLAAQLQQNNIGTNLHLSATLRGEDINLAVNNNNRRRGRGEYVTTR